MFIVEVNLLTFDFSFLGRFEHVVDGLGVLGVLLGFGHELTEANFGFGWT